MHEGEMPEEMVAEIAEVITWMDARGQGLDPVLVLPRLVEDVGRRVHRPGVAWVQRHRALRER